MTAPKLIDVSCPYFQIMWEKWQMFSIVALLRIVFWKKPISINIFGSFQKCWIQSERIHENLERKFPQFFLPFLFWILTSLFSFQIRAQKQYSVKMYVFLLWIWNLKFSQQTNFSPHYTTRRRLDDVNFPV